MRKSFSTALVCTLGLACASTASAQITSDVPAASRGAYVGLDLGYGFENTQITFYDFDEYGYAVNRSTSWQQGNYGFSFGLAIGYQFNPFIGLELDSINMPVPSNSLFDKLNTLSDTQFTDPAYSYVGVASKLYLPLNEKFRLLAKLGVGVSIVSYAEDTYYSSSYYAQGRGAFLGGLGVAYFANKNSEFNFLSTSIVSGSLYDESGASVVQLFTLGYSYHFSS